MVLRYKLDSSESKKEAGHLIRLPSFSYPAVREREFSFLAGIAQLLPAPRLQFHPLSLAVQPHLCDRE